VERLDVAWSGWTWREVALAAWSGLSLDVCGVERRPVA